MSTAAPYILSKTIDPLLALSIGATAFWLRIRREELERWQLAHPSASSSSIPRIAASSPHAAPTAIDARSRESEHAPSHGDTWATLTRRVGALDVRKMEFSQLWKAKDRFGIVEVNK